MLCYSSLVELEYFENLHKPLLCCDTFYYVLMCKALKLKESILSFSITVCTCMHTSVLVVSSNFFLFFFLKLSATAIILDQLLYSSETEENWLSCFHTVTGVGL